MGGEPATHQNVHSGLFWVVSLGWTIFLEDKCFRSTESLERPVLAHCPGRVGMVCVSLCHGAISHDPFRSGPQIPQRVPGAWGRCGPCQCRHDHGSCVFQSKPVMNCWRVGFGIAGSWQGVPVSSGALHSTGAARCLPPD